MNKQEWQISHGFTDEEMEDIDLLLKIFNGKINKIKT